MCNRKAFYRNKFNHAANFRGHDEHSGRKHWREKLKSAFSQPPVNVKESDDKYTLCLYAPGLEKSDFLIATVENTLSVSVDKKEDPAIDWRRWEYTPGGFKRQFELNEKVDKTTISATYKKGVLEITLPKLKGFETTRQKVAVA